MARIKPPPQRDTNINGPIWQAWFNSLRKSVATSVDTPGVDNFASLDANGNIQDSGFDSTSFVIVNGTQDIEMTAPQTWKVGDGTNYTQFASDGEITLAGTARVTRCLMLDLDTGGGTSTIEVFNGAPSINLDTDGETWLLSFKAPHDWNASSDMILVFMVGNEIAETDGDDVSITCQVRGYADGETMSDAGQSVSATLNLTAGDEAINVINRVTGAIDYNEGTYPIAQGDTVVIKATVNLGGAGECTGPLHVVSQWIEYTADKLGTAT